MSKNIIWRCPNCETMNKGDVCFMCGEKRPAYETTANNDTSQRKYKSNNNEMGNEIPEVKPKQIRKKHTNILVNILLTIVLVLLLFVLFCLCYYFFCLKSETSKPNQDTVDSTINNNLDIMNSNAQFIYKSALDYCVICTSYGNSVPDGIYCSALEKEKTDFTYAGTLDDMRNYLNSEIGQDTIQYYCVTVKNGLPNTAFWGTEPLDNIVGSITQDKIIEDNLIIGIYPPYNRADEDLKVIGNIAESNSDNELLDTSQKSFDIQVFEDKLLDNINIERDLMNVYSIKKNENLSEISQSLLTDIYNKTYVKGTSKSYFKEKFEYMSVYFEESFDLSGYTNEDEAACGLLAYEKENFSSKWLDEKFQYFMVNTLVNGDGTYCIVFCLAGDKTITIKNENYPRDLIELDLSGKELTPTDIINIPYMYNLETLKLDDNNIPGTDIFNKLPKLRVLWLDGNGITSLHFLMNCENLETLTLNHNKISDLSPLSKMTSIKRLYLKDNNISDLKAIDSLVNLEVVDFRKNNLTDQEIKDWAKSMPNISEDNV